MIPSFVSWKYQRLDIENPHVHGIANTVTNVLDDISIKQLLPEDIEDFTMFLTIITRNETNHNFIVTILKTKENTGDDEFIYKGSYFSYYLIPSKIDLYSSELRITDMFNPDLFIQFDIPNIFNKEKLNIITLPPNTFIFH